MTGLGALSRALGERLGPRAAALAPAILRDLDDAGLTLISYRAPCDPDEVRLAILDLLELTLHDGRVRLTAAVSAGAAAWRAHNLDSLDGARDYAATRCGDALNDALRRVE